MGPFGLLFRLNKWILGIFGYEVVLKTPKEPLNPFKKVQPLDSHSYIINKANLYSSEYVDRGVEGLLNYREIRLFIENDERDNALIEEIKYKYALEMYNRAYKSIELKVNYRDIIIRIKKH